MDETVPAALSKIVGALPSEVVAMNSLTANLHFLMVSFYRPTTERFKIIVESKSFPSDFVRAVKRNLAWAMWCTVVVLSPPCPPPRRPNVSSLLQHAYPPLALALPCGGWFLVLWPFTPAPACPALVTRVSVCCLLCCPHASHTPHPSVQFAVESQIRFHGFDPKDALIEVSPRAGEVLHRMEDIEAVIAEHGSSTALVLFSGVQYYTGQAYDVRGWMVGWEGEGGVVGEGQERGGHPVLVGTVSYMPSTFARHWCVTVVTLRGLAHVMARVPLVPRTHLCVRTEMHPCRLCCCSFLALLQLHGPWAAWWASTWPMQLGM